MDPGDNLIYLMILSLILDKISFLYEPLPKNIVPIHRLYILVLTPQIKFCGWAYKVNNFIWNFMLISKNIEKIWSLIEVQITK